MDVYSKKKKILSKRQFLPLIKRNANSYLSSNGGKEKNTNKNKIKIKIKSRSIPLSMP
jgi:hypothetical protein